MVDKPESPPVLRIRIKSGDKAGAWLFSMPVSKNGLTIQPINMVNILAQHSQYTFHPSFIAENEKASAFRPISAEIANGYVNVLKSMGYDAEVVAE